MNYVVFDLEWNQSSTGLEPEVVELPFEIIEFGAIKVSDACEMVGEFNELVRPKVYREMQDIISHLVHLQMEELERGKPFPEVAGRFLDWCGEEYLFATWGPQDVTELQRNMKFYHMTPLSDGPIPYLDVQKLYAIAYENRSKQRRGLEAAVDLLGIEKDIPFHRAFSDAYYTSKILLRIREEHPEAFANLSYDTFLPPRSRKGEIHAEFDTYVKYISREFADKDKALADREVASSKCYLCHRNLRKKIRWFTPNGKHYISVAYCETHGYIKYKIRLKQAYDGGIYVVKTAKRIPPEEVAAVAARKEQAAEARRRRRQKLAERERAENEREF